MQKSIQNSFDKSDFNLDEVNICSKWKSIKERANLVAREMFYSVFYGISSHSVHGNRQDILVNNLKRLEDGFELNLQWNNARPQILDGPININLDIIKSFCKIELTDNNLTKSIQENCDKLSDYQLPIITVNNSISMKDKEVAKYLLSKGINISEIARNLNTHRQQVQNLKNNWLSSVAGS